MTPGDVKVLTEEFARACAVWVGHADEEAAIINSRRRLYDAIDDLATRRSVAPELLVELERSIDREYNPFEPDNQSDRYKRLKALRALATGATQ